MARIENINLQLESPVVSTQLEEVNKLVNRAGIRMELVECTSVRAVLSVHKHLDDSPPLTDELTNLVVMYQPVKIGGFVIQMRVPYDNYSKQDQDQLAVAMGYGGMIGEMAIRKAYGGQNLEELNLVETYQSHAIKASNRLKEMAEEVETERQNRSNHPEYKNRHFQKWGKWVNEQLAPWNLVMKSVFDADRQLIITRVFDSKNMDRTGMNVVERGVILRMISGEDLINGENQIHATGALLQANEMQRALVTAVTFSYFRALAESTISDEPDFEGTKDFFNETLFGHFEDRTKIKQ